MDLTMCWTQAILGRHPGNIAAIRIIGPVVCTPVLEGKRRISNDAVKGLQTVCRKEGRGTEGVAAQDLKILYPVQEHIHPGNGAGGEVLLLTIELEGSVIFVIMLEMINAFQQHAAGAASRIIDGFDHMAFP
jgi:hypothetical protein